MPKKPYNRILDEHLHILAAQGNHEAYLKLQKHYHMHALSLCAEILMQYPKSGIMRKELMAVCDDHFPLVIIKYNPALSSFYSFWRESTTQELMDYMIENSYGASASSFCGALSLDNDSNSYAEIIAEINEDQNMRRKIFEIKGLINRNSIFFTNYEKALLLLVLDGYSLKEIEQAKLMSKSNLYLTFNNGVEKLKRCLNRKIKKS